jgi:hypothetical protein
MKAGLSAKSHWRFSPQSSSRLSRWARLLRVAWLIVSVVNRDLDKGARGAFAGVTEPEPDACRAIFAAF